MRFFKVFKLGKNVNKKVKLYYTSGNVRLGAGLYRSVEEQQQYIKKSLKRKLP